MVLEKRAFYEYILQLKMGYVILKLVFFWIILQNKDMVKIKTVVIIVKILANFIVHRNPEFNKLTYCKVKASKISV